PVPLLPAEPDKNETLVIELREQLEVARRALTLKEAEIRTVLAQRDAGITELDSVRQQLASREIAVKELVETGLARETRIRELVVELEVARAQTSGGSDDLKRIKGIGPAFERELRKHGVRSFAQIAAWTEADVDAIAPKIKARAERIRRDNWVGKAAELAGG